MLYSMTGYGHYRSTHSGVQMLSELKSLNGRNTDVRIKLPAPFRSVEPDLRRMILDQVIRGKIDFSLTLEGDVGEEDFKINRKKFVEYYKELSSISREQEIPWTDPISALVRLPNIYTPSALQLDDALRDAILSSCQGALEQLLDYRETEGRATYESLVQNIQAIDSLRIKTVELDTTRVERIRNRIQRHLDLVSPEVEIDAGRLEQELIYYVEKIDYSEENQRLEQHCNYFKEVLQEQDRAKGRKLNFIAQEMGREINTLGSKANDAHVQKIVVQMKDELEQIKEQLANVL